METTYEQLKHMALEKLFLEKSISIVEEGLLRVLWDRRLFLALCFILVILICATVNIEITYPDLNIYASFFKLNFLFFLKGKRRKFLKQL